MILKIANDDRSIIKKGVYLFSLVEYPKIQDWEWNNILAFISYEKACGDKLEIVCENDDILSAVQDAADKIDGKEYIPPIADAIEEFVYHATNVDAAQTILSSGKLLSATKAYGKTGEELVIERKAYGWEDPAHFYEYVMFGWGTHLVGDYVVLSEDFPCEEDFAKGNFDAGVRFYIRYKDIIKHKGHAGYLFMSSLGYDDSARICLTHSFPYKNIGAYNGQNDCSEEETEYIQNYIDMLEYNDYDRLIQLCDAISFPNGPTYVEKRLVDVVIRRGFNDLTIPKWKAFLELKNYFDEKVGMDIYKLLNV